MIAPVVLFAYNRPNHLKKVLEALSKNKLADQSDLYIMIDGPKNEKGLIANEEVMKVAEEYRTGFFKSCTINNHGKNSGLAKSVIYGVSEIVSKYGKVIVIEDDSVPSPLFLSFMNGALEKYADDKRIWSVGGFTIPIKMPPGYDNPVIFTQRCSSYAWGVWRDRWEKIDWGVSSYKKFRFDFIARKRFNRWGPDKASMLDDQMNGRINSWAIRFDYEMFLNNSYNVLPSVSLIRQIGFDGSGTHNRTSANSAIYNVDTHEVYTAEQLFFPDFSLSEDIRKAFERFYKIKTILLGKRYLGNLYYSLKGKKS